MPMLDSASPSTLNAQPDSNAWSLIVPSPRLIHSWFGIRSLAT